MNLLLLVLGLLPASRLKIRLLTLFGRGWRLDPSSRIAPVVLWRVDRLETGPAASIGFGNAFRELAGVRLAEGATIGQFNWFTGAGREADAAGSATEGVLDMAASAFITSRHYLDCCSGVTLATHGAIGGVRCTLMSHGMDVESGVLRRVPITIGVSSLVMANVTMVSGSSVGDHVAVAAGSVVTKHLDGPDTLYGGSPARLLRPLTDPVWLHRDTGAGTP